ncbi:hypothetical protein Taro_029254 [Colocasia esculenta]|uniref:ubiquitinyl hydrolase 1 n=1 Tax=Colocasia esculenta TaxID=4460 RepID=A0A843VDD1_COLES|nr:hypothetical protein [Colocasia esculenta]
MLGGDSLCDFSRDLSDLYGSPVPPVPRRHGRTTPCLGLGEPQARSGHPLGVTRVCRGGTPRHTTDRYDPPAVPDGYVPGRSSPGDGIWEINTVDNGCEWTSFRDDDIMNQQFGIQEEEAEKMPCVGDKEPLTALAAEYQSGSPILLEKIKLLGEQYSAIRRTRGDGNCFFRSFMFSYLEHILEDQDKAELDCIKRNVEECKKTLQDLGYADFTFEDYFESFIELLDSVIQGGEMSIRFVTTSEIRKRSSFFEPFIMGLADGSGSVDQFCKKSVEPMGEESDHIHIIALSDALGVPIRVVYLDRSSCDTGIVNVNHHDFIPLNLSESAASGSHDFVKVDSAKPFVTLLYRPGHYDIVYPKVTVQIQGGDES